MSRLIKREIINVLLYHPQISSRRLSRRQLQRIIFVAGGACFVKILMVTFLPLMG